MFRGTYQSNYWQNQIDIDELEIRQTQARMQGTADKKIRKECLMIIDLLESHIFACKQRI